MLILFSVTFGTNSSWLSPMKNPNPSPPTTPIHRYIYSTRYGL